MKSLKKGFTLIELLIVVAIIAILAAIAVPNFLEAQVRAKVSRAKSDMRTYATAIESYTTDWNEYPPSISGIIPNIDILVLEEMLLPLSTPVAYLSSALLREPFNAKQGALLYEGWDVLGNSGNAPADRGTRNTIYLYVALPPEDVIAAARTLVVVLINSNLPPGLSPITNADADYVISKRWFLVSPGPDTYYQWDFCMRTGGTDIPCLFTQIGGATLPQFDGVYDPTNGTVSQGELVRNGAGIFEGK